MLEEILYDMNEEQWREIPGHGGRYEISSHGRVRSNIVFGGASPTISQKPQRILRQMQTKDGYLRVGLRSTPGCHPVCHAVHRLVLNAFAGPCPEGMECAHIDGNASNNRIDNLKWVTHSTNIGHRRLHGTSPDGDKHWLAVLTQDQVIQIKKTISMGTSRGDLKKLADEYGVSHHVIHKIKVGANWGWLDVG